MTTEQRKIRASERAAEKRALAEVNSWKQQAWDEIKDMSPDEQDDYINRTGAEICAAYGMKFAYAV
jgi:hypothetical protein